MKTTKLDENVILDKTTKLLKLLRLDEFAKRAYIDAKEWSRRQAI